MSDKYSSDRMLKHADVIEKSAWDLLVVASRLCPGEWVLEISPHFDDKNNRTYCASVSNGDDNVTGSGSTISAALADMINYLLHGSVFPLGGSGGRYIHPADRGWVKQEKGGEG